MILLSPSSFVIVVEDACHLFCRKNDTQFNVFHAMYFLLDFSMAKLTYTSSLAFPGSSNPTHMFLFALVVW